MNIKRICSEILELAIYEFKEEENFNNIKKYILNPALDYLISKLYPYIITTCIIFILIFILCIASLAILLNKNIS